MPCLAESVVWLTMLEPSRRILGVLSPCFGPRSSFEHAKYGYRQTFVHKFA